LEELLLQSHGPALLEQLAVLEVAEERLGQKNLRISSADVEQELDLALRQLTDPALPTGSSGFDRAAAERVLAALLEERRISRAEFMLGIRRNACLRKLADVDSPISEDQLREEYERTFGPRMLVRHIQVPTPAEATRLTQKLADGADFAELARQFSANTGSAPKGGMLEPFSADDEAVPLNFREAAARLSPGQVSAAVRVGEWYHLLKLEPMPPTEYPPIEDVRAQLEDRIRQRKSQARMQEMYEAFFREADLRINDPVLQEAFRKRYPGRAP
jgi:foldase protein PrsA